MSQGLSMAIGGGRAERFEIFQHPKASGGRAIVHLESHNRPPNLSDEIQGRLVSIDDALAARCASTRR
jgi:hypothetical protein